MPDRIALLPDAVANQIAAGEVVQRPASVVKELLENAVDAEAKRIDLVIKDGGRTAIQVIDDGYGMSTTDARLSFERHATSKISETDDLFHIATKGFRGEALASIAAVAQVEMKSKTEEAETGTSLSVEGGELKKQEAVQAAQGTSVSVKQLFYNVPARRNFLKSDSVELRHTLDEFQRVALAHPEVHFSLLSNGKLLFNLPAGNLRQRIVGIFGKKINDKLIPLDEQTEVVKITGFIGKSEAAKKRRGEQFFFVNRRFVKHPYLNHAVVDAYRELLSSGIHPPYFVCFAVDPAKIDINIHPTKTEIKFEEEKLIYSILRSSVRHALGIYNVSPTLDFSSNPQLEIDKLDTRPLRPPKVTVDRHFNPFAEPASTTRTSPAETQAWQDFYKEAPQPEARECTSPNPAPEPIVQADKKYFQLNAQYILTQTKSELLIIHQYRAHQRVLYDRFLKSLSEVGALSQKLLFPVVIPLQRAAAAGFEGLRAELLKLGFDFTLERDALNIHSAPAVLQTERIQETAEELLRQLQDDTSSKEELKKSAALILASKAAVRKGQSLSSEEMQNLVDALFASPEHSFSPQGKKIYNAVPLDEIIKKF